MDKSCDINALRSELERCLRSADKLNLTMAAVYIAHALEHVEYVDSVSVKLSVVPNACEDSEAG